MAFADTISLTLRGSRGNKERVPTQVKKSNRDGNKYRVKELFTNKPPPALGRPRAFAQESSRQISEEDVEDEEQEAPLDMATALKKVIELGMKEETIGGRVVPRRIRKSGY